MNEELHEFDDLEQSLRQMPLRAPSPELDRRVSATIHRRPATRWIIGIAAGTLAAAAALLLIVQSMGTGTSAPAPQPDQPLVADATPTQKSSVARLIETSEEWSEDGIVGMESDGPVRQYRLITTHQITVVEDGQLATMTFPQEDVYQYVSQTF